MYIQSSVPDTEATGKELGQRAISCFVFGGVAEMKQQTLIVGLPPRLLPWEKHLRWVH